jgi:hypothetical protein
MPQNLASQATETSYHIASGLSDNLQHLVHTKRVRKLQTHTRIPNSGNLDFIECKRRDSRESKRSLSEYRLMLHICPGQRCRIKPNGSVPFYQMCPPNLGVKSYLTTTKMGFRICINVLKITVSYQVFSMEITY